MNDTGRIVLVVLLVLIALPLLWGTMMMGTMGAGMMGGWAGWAGWDGWTGWSPWRGFLAVVSPLLVIAGIAVVVWWALGRGGGGVPASRGTGARALLDERYARGELTREQYQQMRRDLES